MPVGQQTTEAGINGNLTALALRLRDVCQDILYEQGYLNKLGMAGLQSLGFTSPEATQVLDDINHMGTVAQVYKGTATQTPVFNFEDFLTHLWAEVLT